MKIEFLADHMGSREAIASWFIKEWGSRYPERDLSCWTETQTYPNKGKLPLTLIAIENDEIVGTVCLRTDGMTTHSEWTAWLSYLVVPESHRGKGIAKALIRKAEVVAKEMGIDELHLFTRLEEPKLYADLGWDMVHIEEYRGGKVSVMEKKIKPELTHTSRANFFNFFKNHPYVTSAAFATASISMAYFALKN